jgi:intracellular multiplication protein IcmP
MAVSANDRGNSGKVGIGTGLGMMAGILALLFFSAWLTYHDQTARFLLKYAYYLNMPMSWITTKLGIAYFAENTQEIVLLASNISRVTLDDLFRVINAASVIYIPFLIVLGYSAWKIHSHVLRRLESLHDHWQLMKLQSLTNPCIVPVVRFTEYWRAHNIERHKNLFRALTPDEFASRFDLLKKENDKVLMDYEKTIKVFETQLGAQFDVAKLKPHYKALAVIFMTRILYRGEEGRNKAKRMQDTINLSCDPSKTEKVNDTDCTPAFEFTEVMQEFDMLFKRNEIQRIAAFFPFEKVFLMQLLQEARKDGKLAPSEFIWLKLIDRPLFYALYGVSKSLIAKGYAEGSAAFAQYWASVTMMGMNQIVFAPCMHEAAAALEKRLFEANMVSERELMTQRERERETEFGRIPEV